jgi:hypothetical protein
MRDCDAHRVRGEADLAPKEPFAKLTTCGDALRTQ